MFETCTCGHERNKHADHVNPLQVVRLHMTDSDDDREARPPTSVVYGAGACKIEGCNCPRFTDRA